MKKISNLLMLTLVAFTPGFAAHEEFVQRQVDSINSNSQKAKAIETPVNLFLTL